jgi:hypothetical protein
MSGFFSVLVKKPNEDWVRHEMPLDDLGTFSADVVSNTQLEKAVKEALKLPDGSLLYRMTLTVSKP